MPTSNRKQTSAFPTMAFLHPIPFIPSAAPHRPCTHRIVPPCVAQPRRRLRPSMSHSSPSKPANSVHPTCTDASSVSAFFLELGVSREDSGRIASRTPSLLGVRDLHARARPALEFLSELGLSSRQTSRALRHAPKIVLREAAEFAPRIAFLRDVARFPPHRLPAAVARCPHVLWMEVARARRVLDIVRTACPTLSADAVGAMLARAPQALVRAPRRIQRNIDFVREKAGVTEAGAVSRVFAKVPLALVYDIDTNLAARVNYFMGEVGLDKRGVGRVIMATPEVLMWGIDSLMRPKIEAIASVVGQDGVKQVLHKVPALLASDAILDCALWLRDVVGLDAAQVATVVREAPAVLSYSIVGNLAPKWAFVQGTMGGTADDVVKAPREILCANLQQRAVPRYAFLASKGIEDVTVVDILKGSDIEFCKNIAKCDPAQFRKYVDNDTYLLFFSQLL